MAAVEGEVRRNMWGHEYRTASADCAAALDANYAHTMAFGRGRGPTVLRAAAVDPSCVLASTLATPWDPARAAALLAAAAGVRLVGCCNELNAAYTADGYARARGGGVGACAVTFTVGGLSVINVVAGAFSENLPVVCIVGGPNSNDYGSNRILHHTIGLPDFTQELSYVDAILTIPKGSLFPMCGMNLAFDRELIGPAMYFGLMGDGHPFGRYDDMWAGWCTKAHPPGAVNVQIYGLIKEWTAWDISGRVAFAFFDIFA